MLPADFPDWRTCYKYFRQWSERSGPQEESILDYALRISSGLSEGVHHSVVQGDGDFLSVGAVSMAARSWTTVAEESCTTCLITGGSKSCRVVGHRSRKRGS